MSISVFTTNGEDLTNGEGYYVPLCDLARVEAELRADGFVVVKVG